MEIAKKEIVKLAYSKREAKLASTLNIRTLDYLIQKGKLRALKIGRRVLIPAKELEKLLEGSK